MEFSRHIHKLKAFILSLRRRKGLLIVIVAALILELISGIQYRYMHGIMKDEMEHRAESELIIKAIITRRVVDNTERSLKSHIMEVKKGLGQPDSLMGIVGSIAKYTSNIIGCGIAFKPDYYSEKGRLFEPYALQTDSGIVCRQIAGDRFDYTKDGFYRDIMEKGENRWVGPYDDVYLKARLISYAVPIYEFTGDTVAVFGIDIQTQVLGDTLNRRHLYPSSFDVLLTEDGQFISGPPEPDLQPKVRELVSLINDSTVSKVWNKEHTMRIATYYDRDRKDNATVFVAHIRGAPRWQVAIVCYDSEVYGKLNRMKSGIMLLMLLGLALLGIIVYVFFRGAEHLRLAQLEQARISGELHVANGIQQALVGQFEPSLAGIDDVRIRGRLIPAKEVGGDLYYTLARDGKLFFCIGDVSGKGIPSALIMTIVQALFRNICAREDNPAHIMDRLNETVCFGNDTNTFVTLFVGVLNLPSGRLRYCNAGHELPVVIDSKSAHLLSEAKPNLPVGLFGDFRYEMQEAHMEPGSALFLYTDGLNEARNAQGKLFGRENVVAGLAGSDPTDPNALVEGIISRWKAFAGTTEQSDDLTLLAVSYTPAQEPTLFDSELTLSNSVGEVEALGNFVKSVTRELGFDSGLTSKIRLAVEEAVVNVMEYAYPAGQSGNIHIRATASSRRLVIVITDSGIPFNPTEISAADTTLSAEERPIGGLGILLVRQLMDSINYERTDGKNILTLSKTIKPQ